MNRKELGVTLDYEVTSELQVVARFESGRAGVPKAKIEKLLVNGPFHGSTVASLLKQALAEEDRTDEPPADSHADMHQDVIRIIQVEAKDFMVFSTSTSTSTFTFRHVS